MTSQTESEYQEFEENNAWHGIYQRLKNEASLAMHGEDFSTSCARHPDNRRRNRYRDVSPYNHSRIILLGENDYINASLVEVPEVDRRYILTQGPVDNTICDFWQMTWEQKSRAVVMLNRVIEKGTVKCSQYWPLGSQYGCEDEMYFPECDLKVTLTREQNMGHFFLRTLVLEKLETQEKREVLHFHYITWPDFGIPSSPNSFLHFLHVVRQTGSLDTDVGPAIVHCSAGIGRSGTFCLVDSCLVLVENNSSLECVDVRQTLIKMRFYRMGLIQTPDQLKFSYQAIIQGAFAILNGNGLGELDPSSEMNHIDGTPPPPPQRTSSLQPHQSIDGHDGNNGDMVAPPLPPKKSKMLDKSGLEPHGEEEDSEDEDFDELIDRREDEEEEEESSEESEDEIMAAKLRQQIREQRKKETMEKIQQMKERQRKSEKYPRYKSYFGPMFYFGLAVLVGLSGIAVYKYLY